jgi:hypothetical protein
LCKETQAAILKKRVVVMKTRKSVAAKRKLILFSFSSHRGVMDTNSLPTLLKDWKEESLRETDETLMLLDEMKRIEECHRKILALSSDLEEAYYLLLQKVK